MIRPASIIASWHHSSLPRSMESPLANLVIHLASLIALWPDAYYWLMPRKIMTVFLFYLSSAIAQVYGELLGMYLASTIASCHHWLLRVLRHPSETGKELTCLRCRLSRSLQNATYLNNLESSIRQLALSHFSSFKSFTCLYCG